MATTRNFSQTLGTGANNFSGAAVGSGVNTNLTPRLLAMALEPLRNNSIMRSLVTTDYDTLAVEKGASIDVPLPPQLTVSDVQPGQTPIQGQAADFGVVSVPINEWRKSDFRLTDREMRQIDEKSFFQGAGGEAVNQLADDIDRFILNQYRDVYTIVGQSQQSDSDTTIVPQDESDASDDDGNINQPYVDPFPNTDDGIYSLVEAGRVLNDMKAYPRDRRFVGNPAANARSLFLRSFTDASWMGSLDGVERGEIVQKYGFSMHMDQNVPIHTTRASAGNGTWTLDTTSAHAEGATSVQLKLTAAATNPEGSRGPDHGDIMEIAGQGGQTYVVTAQVSGTMIDADSHTAGAEVTVAANISPPLRNAIAAAATEPAVTFKPSHAVNLAFHPKAFMFVTRPLSMPEVSSGNYIASALDPLSGITLRLEVERQNKQTYYSYDVLYGAALLRPELVTRVAGRAV